MGGVGHLVSGCWDAHTQAHSHSHSRMQQRTRGQALAHEPHVHGTPSRGPGLRTHDGHAVHVGGPFEEDVCGASDGQATACSSLACTSVTLDSACVERDVLDASARIDAVLDAYMQALGIDASLIGTCDTEDASVLAHAQCPGHADDDAGHDERSLHASAAPHGAAHSSARACEGVGEAAGTCGSGGHAQGAVGAGMCVTHHHEDGTNSHGRANSTVHAWLQSHRRDANQGAHAVHARGQEASTAATGAATVPSRGSAGHETERHARARQASRERDGCGVAQACVLDDTSGSSRRQCEAALGVTAGGGQRSDAYECQEGDGGDALGRYMEALRVALRKAERVRACRAVVPLHCDLRALAQRQMRHNRDEPSPQAAGTPRTEDSSQASTAGPHRNKRDTDHVSERHACACEPSGRAHADDKDDCLSDVQAAAVRQPALRAEGSAHVHVRACTDTPDMAQPRGARHATSLSGKSQAAPMYGSRRSAAHVGTPQIRSCKPLDGRRQMSSSEGRRQTSSSEGRRQTSSSEGRRQTSSSEGRRQTSSSQDKRQTMVRADKGLGCARCAHRNEESAGARAARGESLLRR